MTEKLLTYALGRGLDYYDMPTVRAIVRDAAPANYRFSSLVLGIVDSAPFQMRMAQAQRRAHGQRQRRFVTRRLTAMFITKTVAAAPDVPARHGRHRGAAAARRDGAGA